MRLYNILRMKSQLMNWFLQRIVFATSKHGDVYKISESQQTDTFVWITSSCTSAENFRDALQRLLWWTTTQTTICKWHGLLATAELLVFTACTNDAQYVNDMIVVRWQDGGVDGDGGWCGSQLCWWDGDWSIVHCQLADWPSNKHCCPLSRTAARVR